MKLWEQEETSQDEQLRKQVQRFTVGNDPHWDLLLADCDVRGSMAHAEMLYHTGLLDSTEFAGIRQGLSEILGSIREGTFVMDPGAEDIHSQVETMLTARIGEAGKKLHTARSRNDQSLTDIKLYLKQQTTPILEKTQVLFNALTELAHMHRDVLLPGYTHSQLAMPSSFGLWFGAYAESLCDDLEVLLSAWKVTDRNPLGTAAGYGSSFPISREITTELLGFSGMHVNSVYAQMSRGKTEKLYAFAMSSLAATLSKMSSDICLFVNINYGFMRFPASLCTGSSIMPHKRNPDVFELIRAKCARIQALPNELSMLCNNLGSGYHRDMQLSKDCLFPRLSDLQECLDMAALMLRHVEVNQNLARDTRYTLMYTVESVNALVQQGIGFRDAYMEVSRQVNAGSYQAAGMYPHTHTGSIGNPGLELIQARFAGLLEQFLLNPGQH